MRSSLTRGILRLLLGSYLEKDPASLQFDESDGKKPRLISEPEGLEFNLSHSHEWALIAIARHLAVGVDIECIRSEVDIDGIAPSIFTSREWAPIAGLDHASRLEAFFRGWVRKEAAIKLLGGGFQIPLHSIEVGCLPRREDEDAIVVHEAGGVRQLYGIDLHAPEGYCAALACDTHPGRLTEFLYPLSQSLEH
jgi:4'-phosphopantetheinyl transferase